MKISQLMRNTTADFENRKRALQRRETTEAYRKSAQFQSPKNPMLEALENLLSGKTEKELHKADEALRKSETATLEGEVVVNPVTEEQMANQEVIKHEQEHKSVDGSLTGPVSYTYTEGPDDQRYINGGEVSINAKEGSTPEETLKILERVRAAALAPADPSPQDLRVAASAVSQMQQVRSEISSANYEESTQDDEQEPFADNDLTTEIPGRFLHDFASRDVEKKTPFGKDLESLIFDRTFMKATTKYNEQIAMVKNGYRSSSEPLFSKSA